jgi:hypothetical protein
MKIISHQTEHIKSAEVISNDMLIATIEDGANLMVDLYYQGFDRIIIHQKNITPAKVSMTLNMKVIKLKTYILQIPFLK